MPFKMLPSKKPKGTKQVKTCTAEYGVDFLYRDDHEEVDDPVDTEESTDEESVDGEADSVHVANQEQTSTTAAPPAVDTPKHKGKTPFSALRSVFTFSKKVQPKRGYYSCAPRCQRNAEDDRAANMEDKARLRLVLDASYLTKDQEDWIIKLHVCISKYAHLSMDDYCGSPNLKRTLKCFFTNEMETAGALADLNRSKPNSRLLVWGPPGTGTLSF